jgi:hypothetical protein
MLLWLRLLLATSGIASPLGNPPLKLAPAPSTAQQRNADVQRALLSFRIVRTPEEQADPLALFRERDRLLLFHAPMPSTVAYGFMLFGALTVMTAHAPKILRPLFQAPVHVGPALFDRGGYGAGVGGRFL